MSHLIDLSALGDDCCNHALDELYKATTNDPPGSDIWAEMDSPFLRRLVEIFTQRGLTRLGALQMELLRWLAGELHREHAQQPARPENTMGRWTKTELQLTRIYLEALPRNEFTLDDWMLCVDYLVQRYLPADEMRSEAEWLAVRASLMGRVQANLLAITDQQADQLLTAMPSTARRAEAEFGLSHEQRAVLEFGRARCAEHVVQLADSTRHQMRKLIIDHQEAVFMGDKSATDQSLQTKLFDTFAELNRDWRRIAVTEATENFGQGLVACQPAGSKLRRLERYSGACPWCKKIDGHEFSVVSASDPYKDGMKSIWTGKTNVGRSASPRKRVGGSLVERNPSELWWVAAGAQHPNCRGRWEPVRQPEPGDDPDFADWLKKTLTRPK